MEERAQKILAQAGYGSRRACEQIIAAGRVTVNGKLIQLGDKADPDKDEIRIDGRVVKPPEKTVYIALHKPRGVVSTTEDEEGRKTVLDLVPSDVRLFMVGRLDLESEGLVLLTNDGQLANRLMHPRYEHEKEYRVLLARHPDDEQLRLWRKGVILEDGYQTAPAKVFLDRYQGKGTWVKVIMREGRKRQIREVANRIGLPVVSLVRTRIGSLKLGSMPKGDWRYLNEAEIAALKGETPKQTRKKSAPKKSPYKSKRNSRRR
ncbi:MAG: rRNA pseudouridine synthase [Anaerolineales bacterium]|nr:rRNA pseudouridine synthase [Anaerolineales bacterium]